MATISRRTRHYYRRLVRSILRTNDSPRQIAGGVAVGMFFAFTPTVGFQMILAALFATILRCSRLPALVVVYVTNPFTAIPIFSVCYVLGVGVIERFGFRTLRFESIQKFLVCPEDWGFWETIYRKLIEMSALGWEGLLPLWLGGVIAGGTSAAVAYYVTLRFVTGHRLLKAQRMARRAQRRLELIRERQARQQQSRSGDDAHE